MWLLYDFVARTFLASLSPDCIYRRTRVTFTAGGETFFAEGCRTLRPGWTAVMPWRAVQNRPLPDFNDGETVPLHDATLEAGRTSPPDYLSESELIELMVQHGIGTDASIPVHINNICERGYVRVESGRRVVPTDLGVTLIRGYQLIDPELCRPQARRDLQL